MVNFYVQPTSSLQGSLTIPPSKSHTLRAIFFAALARGKSHIQSYLPSPDTVAMIEAIRLLGAEVKVHPDHLEIIGFGNKPQAASDVIQCGNSGQVLRFVGAYAGLLPYYTILTGDASIRQNRPVKPLLEGLNQLGAFAVSACGNDYAPLVIKGPLTKGKATLEGQDSQPVTGLLIAAAFASHPIELQVTNPGEKPWIELTLAWLKRLGIPYQREGYHYYRLEGKTQLEGFDYTVPGDFSTAAFPLAAALITKSELTLHNIDMKDCQGDKAIIPVLQKMGANFVIDEEKRTLKIKKGSALQGIPIDVNDFIDALPVLAVVACFSEGKTEIFNAAVARKKESDRIHTIYKELQKMGAQIEEKPEGLVIYGSALQGADLNTYHDHRLALSLTVAALAAQSPSTVRGVECMAKTYPSFYEDFRVIGANIEK